MRSVACPLTWFGLIGDPLGCVSGIAVSSACSGWPRAPAAIAATPEITGNAGAPGQVGAPGRVGIDGKDGAPGQTGATGQTGAPGQQGPGQQRELAICPPVPTATGSRRPDDGAGALAAYGRDRFLRMLSEPDPRFEGLTPREAARSSSHRSGLERWLRTLENSAAHGRADDAMTPDVATIRRELAIAGDAA